MLRSNNIVTRMLDALFIRKKQRKAPIWKGGPSAVFEDDTCIFKCGLFIVSLIFVSGFFFSATVDHDIPRVAEMYLERHGLENPKTVVMNEECDGRAVTLRNGGFSPHEGNKSTVFRFTATYYNGDDMEAAGHDIIIDSIPYEMKHVSGDPVSGSVYEYRTKLSMGPHKYQFHFPPLFLPENGAFKGPTVNRPSCLFWTHEENYENNGVFPSSGVSTDDFQFRISYTDEDNDDPRDLPGYIKLVLDGVSYSMGTVDELFSDGSIFTFNLSGLAPGEHEYHFECFDGHYGIRFPNSGKLSLPVINTRPELIVPRLPTLGGNTLSGTVFPGIANVTDKFTFQIIYLDIDNHPPSTRTGSRGVYIDNVFYNMAPQEGIGIYYDGNYANGEIFEVNLLLPLGDSHSYYFEFTDELLATNYTDLFEGPVVVEGFPDLRIARENEKPLISGRPSSTDHSDWYDILISAVIENPSDFSVNEPFYVSFEIFHADRRTGVFDSQGIFSERVSHLYDHSRMTVYLDSFSPMEMGNYRVVVTVDDKDEIREIMDNNDAKTNNVGDPQLFFLTPDGSGQGGANQINTDLYRILVLKMTLPGDWDLNRGSVARIVWKKSGDSSGMNVSEDMILRHKSGSPLVMNSIIADLKNVPLESGAGSPSHSGWTGMVEVFRVDPHEFSSPYNFYIYNILKFQLRIN